MKGVLALCFMLSFIATIHGECPVRSYTTKLVPACDANDLRIKWPNYANQSTYYSCLTVNYPALVSCPQYEVFVYVLQKCKGCDKYLPPIECSKLPTQNPPKCVPLGESVGSSSTAPTTSTASTASSSLPTPFYPSSTASPPTSSSPEPSSSTSIPTATTPTNNSTAESTQNPTNTTSSIPTPPSIPTGTSTVPPPPSPSTNDPNVPHPPTPDPTPQVINPTPPTRKPKVLNHNVK